MTNNELATKMGTSVEQVETMLKVLAYRKEYNKRPDVVERRKVYTAQRNARLTMLSQILKGGV